MMPTLIREFCFLLWYFYLLKHILHIMGKDKNLTNKEYIESDKNPFPRMDIIPGIGWVKRLGNLVCYVYFNKDEPENTGASPALDDALYDTEHAVGHMMAVGEISAEEATDWLDRIDWIEQAVLFPGKV